MSYTIVDDDGVIQVRASIRTLQELEELIEKLTARKEALEAAEKPTEEKSDV